MNDLIAQFGAKFLFIWEALISSLTMALRNYLDRVAISAIGTEQSGTFQSYLLSAWLCFLWASRAALKHVFLKMLLLFVLKLSPSS